MTAQKNRGKLFYFCESLLQNSVLQRGGWLAGSKIFYFLHFVLCIWAFFLGGGYGSFILVPPKRTWGILDSGIAVHKKTQGAQRGHSTGTAPIIVLFIPRTPLKTTHLQKHARTIQNGVGCRIQDPGTHGRHQTEKKNPWCTSRGCRVQNSGPWDPWLPVVENSRLFAQRVHSARCAPTV